MKCDLYSKRYLNILAAYYWFGIKTIQKINNNLFKSSGSGRIQVGVPEWLYCLIFISICQLKRFLKLKFSSKYHDIQLYNYNNRLFTSYFWIPIKVWKPGGTALPRAAINGTSTRSWTSTFRPASWIPHKPSLYSSC